MNDKKIIMLIVSVISLIILAFLPQKTLSWQAESLELIQNSNECSIEILELDGVHNPYLSNLTERNTELKIEIEKRNSELKNIPWYLATLKSPIYWRKGNNLKNSLLKIENQLFDLKDKIQQ